MVAPISDGNCDCSAAASCCDLQRIGTDTEAISRTYDDATSGAFGIGRLATMSDPTGSASYAYDRRGMLCSEAKAIESSNYSLRGQALMRLGHVAEAVQQFREMSAPELVRAVMPASLSLDLAALLVREGVARDDSLQYLGQVKAKAQSRNDAGLVQRVTMLEQLAR